MKMPFGNYKNWNISDVPHEYLTWLHEKSVSDAKRIKEELDRRESMEDCKGTWMEQIVKAGYRALSLKHHPDVGGSNESMREINASFEKLKSKIK